MGRRRVRRGSGAAVKTFLGLEFERDAVAENLRIRSDNMLKKAYVQFRAPSECWTELSGPDLVSLEAMVTSLAARKVFPGPEIVATIQAEIERRKHKLPERVGPWRIGKPDSDQDVWVSAWTESSSHGAPLQGHIHVDQLIPELNRITLETLVALCGGWRRVKWGDRVAKGCYLVRRGEEVWVQDCHGGDGRWHRERELLGPLPLDELAKVGRP